MILFIIIQSILLSNNSDATGMSDKDFYFIKNNPAIVNNDLIFGVKPNIFGIKELDDVYCSTNYNIKNININANLFSSGNNGLNNNIIFSIGGIYKYNLFNIGIRLNYNNIFIKNYLNSNYFNIDLGAVYYLNDKISIGGYYNNININNNNQTINNEFLSSAISYKYDIISFFIGADILFNINYGLNSGIKFKINNYISFRINYSTILNSLNSALNIKYKNININLFLNKHNELGYSQEYQLIYDY